MKRRRGGGARGAAARAARDDEEKEEPELLSRGAVLDSEGESSSSADEEELSSEAEDIDEDEGEGSAESEAEGGDKGEGGGEGGRRTASGSSSVRNLAELSDSEDEQGERNRVGKVPLEWYDEEDHIGYTVTGEKIIRKDRGDALDDFLSRTDDPARWRTVYDKLNDEKIVLSREEMDIVHRVRQGRFPERSFDPYQDVGYRLTPRVESLHNAQPPKRGFVPSKHEAKIVARLVRAIRNGWLKRSDDPEAQTKARPSAYLLWDATSDLANQNPHHIPAPRLKPPGHAESYNPPPEYLPTEEEKQQWSQLLPEDRPYGFLPTAHAALRHVPAFDGLVKERFERCLDLYLCPRVRRRRAHIDPESLIPTLPKAADLKPFPETCMVTYQGHTGRVRTVTVSPEGQWIATGSDDKTVRVWEVDTGRCVRVIQAGNVVDRVAWNPNPEIPMLAYAIDGKLMLVHTHTGSAEETRAVEALLGPREPEPDRMPKPKVTWTSERDSSDAGEWHRAVVDIKRRARSLAWHVRGDYVSTASPDSTSLSVQIHRVSRAETHVPFTKSKGFVQSVAFHPNKPLFFVATKRHVRIYDLVQHSLVKKLQSPARWISSVSVHPGGDNIIVGSYDCRVCWYDLDLSNRPYKTLKFHQMAVRQVAYHPRYPLFASASDEGRMHVFHGKVYEDLLTNPLIVPVKTIKAHTPVGNLGALDCVFHPTQPWLFSSGADGLVKLFC